MPSETSPRFELISKVDALHRAVERWLAEPVLALDTEFVRERTFYPRLGLIQVADSQGTVLIDPIAIRDLTPFEQVLGAPQTLKVFHSAGQDLEVLYRLFRSFPEPLFDTQEAAALASIGPNLGYGRLVSELLGVELAKGETRTDWTARPLSSAQLDYAAEDVTYLLSLYERLHSELRRLGRVEWALADSAALSDPRRFEEEPEQAFRRIKGAGKLDPRRLAIVHRLAAWREREARRRDVPRNMVLREELLLLIATKRPATVEDLKKLPGCSVALAAREGETWLGLLREVAELPNAELPAAADRWRRSPALDALEDRLRQTVRDRAAELGLAPEVLASRKHLSAILQSAVSDPEVRLPHSLLGWRKESIGDELVRVAAEAKAAGLAAT